MPSMTPCGTTIGSPRETITGSVNTGRNAGRSSSRGSLDSLDSNVPLPSLEDIAPTRPPTTIEGSETVLSIPDLERDVRLKIDAGPGCGGIAWPAGEVLSRYLAYRHTVDPTALRNKKVVELGSGTGLVGIVVGILEPSTEIWVTDQSQLLDLMEKNVQGNKVGTHVHVAELNWGDDFASGIPVKDVDVVLAADCVYFEPAFPLLVNTLCDLVPVGKPIEILFCWKKRRKADRRFFQMLKKHFLSSVIEDDRPGEKERYGRERVSLIRLTRRK